MNEIIEAAKTVEGEVLTDKLPDTEHEMVLALLQECEESLTTILEMAQMIDHGMTDCPPNKPNREIVREATAMLARFQKAHEAAEALENQRATNNLPMIEG